MIHRLLAVCTSLCADPVRLFQIVLVMLVLLTLTGLLLTSTPHVLAECALGSVCPTP